MCWFVVSSPVAASIVTAVVIDANNRGRVRLIWLNNQMIFGGGDIQRYYRLTKCIDVIAYTYTTGVIFSGDKPEFRGQSGALFDHFCNVFGSLVKQYDRNQTTDKADWLIGEGMFTKKVNAKAFRSMSDPGSAYNDPLLGGKDAQVSHMRDYKKLDFDNGGMHIFSGTPNRAFYLAATEIGDYAWEKIGRIWYEAMGRVFKNRATFESMTKITYSLAGSLFGDGKKEQRAVKNGWEGVGIKIA